TVVLALSLCLFVACNKADEPKTEDVSYGAYILSDKGTYLSNKNNPDGDQIPNLTLLFEADNNLKNTYTMIAVDGDGAGFGENPQDLNEIGADCFIKWMSLASTREILGNYGINEGFGEKLFYLLDGAEIYDGNASELVYEGSGATTNVIKISTTTSVKDTGLLGYLEGIFEQATGWDIQVTSAGTGKAIQNAKDGLADLLLVHSKSQEEAFVSAGYARTVDSFSATRLSFMYNYFVLIGPKADPANVKEAASIDAAFKAIADNKCSFVSRGDNSGTHTKEISLWKLAGINDIDWDAEAGAAKYNPEYTWYTATGTGMTASLTVANEKASK
ncbi:MAG: substrate-binding domain-containing protein, partial [Clostridia bacterium]|nr:substrate-binding domain-containing protein [Clostridia bacterium]